MQAYAHPQLPGTHVVLDVRACPRTFRMLTELTCGSEALQYDDALLGFVMTLDVYQTLRTRLSGATSLLDLMGILPMKKQTSHLCDVGHTAVTSPTVSDSTRSIHTQTQTTETYTVTSCIGTQTDVPLPPPIPTFAVTVPVTAPIVSPPAPPSVNVSFPNPINHSVVENQVEPPLPIPAGTATTTAQQQPINVADVQTAVTEEDDVVLATEPDWMKPSARSEVLGEQIESKAPEYDACTESWRGDIPNPMSAGRFLMQRENRPPALVPSQRTFQEMAGNDDAASGISDFHWIHLRRLQVMDILSDR